MNTKGKKKIGNTFQKTIHDGNVKKDTKQNRTEAFHLLTNKQKKQKPTTKTHPRKTKRLKEKHKKKKNKK